MKSHDDGDDEDPPKAEVEEATRGRVEQEGSLRQIDPTSAAVPMNNLVVSSAFSSNSTGTISTQQNTNIIELRENDVLLGRGTGPTQNLGNIRFRSLVHERLKRACRLDESSLKEVLESSPSLSPRITAFSVPQKVSVARDIVKIINSKGGRFLEEIGRRAPRDPFICYRQVTRYVAVEKTKQSFRHQMRVIEQEEGEGGERPKTGSPCREKQPPRSKIRRIGNVESSDGFGGSGRDQHAARGILQSSILPGAALVNQPLLVYHHSNKPNLSNNVLDFIRAGGGSTAPSGASQQNSTSTTGILNKFAIPNILRSSIHAEQPHQYYQISGSQLPYLPQLSDLMMQSNVARAISVAAEASLRHRQQQQQQQQQQSASRDAAVRSIMLMIRQEQEQRQRNQFR